MPETKVARAQIERLREICGAKIADFEKEGVVTPTPNNMRYIFKDRGADILAVAHLDTVVSQHHFDMDGLVIRSPQLDDRLGAWVILELLKDLPYDILLTEGEETGQSTAQHFKTDKKYKWMFEFDRTGRDCVMYQYDTPFLRTLLQSVGISPGKGSISDISYLGHLGCSGINMGVGYYDYHSVNSYMRIDHTLEQASLFREFFEQNKDVYLRHQSRCRTCGATEGIDKSGYCDAHKYGRGYSSSNYYEDEYYERSYTRHHRTNEEKKRRWTEFDWDGLSNQKQLPLLGNPSPESSSESEEYDWAIL